MQIEYEFVQVVVFVQCIQMFGQFGDCVVLKLGNVNLVVVRFGEFGFDVLNFDDFMDQCDFQWFGFVFVQDGQFDWCFWFVVYFFDGVIQCQVFDWCFI